MNVKNFFPQGLVQATKDLIARREQEDLDYLQKKVMAAEGNDATDKMFAMHDLGYEFVRRSRNEDEIPVGVGWFLGSIEVYDSASLSLLANDSLDRDYFNAKRFLAEIYLPLVPFFANAIKEKASGVVDQDPALGFKLLQDIVESHYATPTDYLKASVLYFTGTAVEQNIKLARAYFNKADELDDSASPEIDPDFKEYYLFKLSREKDENPIEKARKDAWEFAWAVAEEYGTTPSQLNKFIRCVFDSPDWLSEHPKERDAVERLFADENESGKIFIWNSLEHWEFYGDAQLNPDSAKYLSAGLWDFLQKDWSVIRHSHLFTGNQNGPIETERLLLKPTTQEYQDLFMIRILEAGEFESYFNFQYQGQAVDIVHRSLYYAITEKGTNEFLGIIGLENKGYLDWFNVEYFVFPAYRRKGYVTEALKALMDFVFSGNAKIEVQTPYECLFKTVTIIPSYLEAYPWEKNIASRKTVERCGFEFCEKREGEAGLFILQTGKKEPALYYRMTADRWNRFKKVKG